MAVDKIDKYKIIGHLGNGHFGTVYHCYDPYLQKEIAIKIIKVPNPEKFVTAVKEGQALEHCRHKHIVDVKDVRASFFEGDRVVIIVMEYLAKGSIQKHIEKRFISVSESCKIIQQALMGLEHAHNNNVIHRDVKPGNILFGDNKESKLSDFGLAINYHSELSDELGYRPHQPLEVIEGNPMNKLSDIYATGITLYRLLNNTNKLPFTFKDKAEWAKAVKKDKFPPREYLPHIPKKIISLANKAIHKLDTKRFQDCMKFRQAIDKIKFDIDWVQIDANNWIGNTKKNKYEISKIEKRKGWTIDFTKNGKRKTEFCFKNVPDDKVEEEFYSVISESTLG